MLFNSFDFAIFLPIVFLLYWFVFQKDLKWQNALVAVASYVFYGWWDLRFLSLILFSTLVDYSVGIGLGRTENISKRKILLWISVIFNLGLLGVFKYYNFFLDNFISAFSVFGQELSANSLDIILPVGISFYTFQTMSYTIDVYKRKLEPTKDFIAFTAFVSFFPQLVAGPIERATNLLPQFYEKRKFEYSKAVDGMQQILWGLFKKMVIADNCAIYANHAFENSSDLSGSTLLMGVIFFAFQIYGDFSGYSDIAIGTAKLFGFNLTQNFAFPYFSRDIGEFWRRWHISLSAWFRDYLYIPLGGSRGGLWMKIRNIFIIFILSGFWHGANWTFIFWGGLNALYFLPLLLNERNRQHMNIVAAGSNLPTLKESFQIITTFSLTIIAWVFFRATDIDHALAYLSTIFSKSIFSVPDISSKRILLFLGILIIAEWFGRKGKHPFDNPYFGKSKVLRWSFYLFFIAILFLFSDNSDSFIYFQF